MNAQLQTLSETLEQRIKSRTGLQIAELIQRANEIAGAAYKAELRRVYGHRFDLVVETALNDAEVAMAQAIKPYAEEAAIAAAIEKIASV
jgi:hypothetical protein